MEAMDIRNYWNKARNISPTLKLVSIVLLLALKYEADSVTFSRKRGKIARLLYTPKGCGECEMVPPPCHLSPLIMKILRRMGREAAKNSVSAFSFSYTETG